ncbi:tannase and feruloyl esterase [Roridomyces roridus]|uniref:Carboxylic ester hydrolase n=1 Tax=Roridomyces roridus TaxID=1738132 RepID=A0AAD7C2U0_9AGAR|nr:tannase and feruloyl esterase [Roridomyces roridus]
MHERARLHHNRRRLLGSLINCHHDLEASLLLEDSAEAFSMDFLNLNYISKLLTSSLPLFSSWGHGENYQRCMALKTNLTIENTTILDVAYVRGGRTVKTQGPCYSKASVSASLCRVHFTTETSPTSSIRAEAWLPDDWHGRFLALGNGGLGGCISYRELDYGSAMHFATVGSNNGHDGNRVLHDYVSRSIHTEALVGKQIVEMYYGRPHDKSYYIGCSSGGRQATYSALHYPQDFDGVVAGAPATDFNHLLHWTGMLGRALGAPDPQSSSAFIPAGLWKLVAAEILSQCDALDGVRDGVITEPDSCDFRPEALICKNGDSGEKCPSLAQVNALRKIYAPLYDQGELVMPRFDPGSEALYMDSVVFKGEISPYPRDWLQYVVLNVTEFDFGQYGPVQGRLMEEANPYGIKTFDGDMSAFRDRGGKFLTYHGRIDPQIPSGNSKRMYDLVSRTLGMPSLDEFYRLFLVPGMGHCAGGPGAADFGQPGVASNKFNASSHNVLLAIVDWVEAGVAPDNITGTAADGSVRVHCRYPKKSVWDGEKYGCTE